MKKIEELIAISALILITLSISGCVEFRSTVPQTTDSITPTQATDCVIKSFNSATGYTYTGNCKDIIDSIQKDKQQAIDNQDRIYQEAIYKSKCYVTVRKDNGNIVSVSTKGNCEVSEL